RQRRASAASRSKLVICAARWSTSACASSSRGFAGMSKEQTKPSESLVQELLNERRSLKVAVERLKLELADAQSGSGGPDPDLGDARCGNVPAPVVEGADQKNDPVDDADQVDQAPERQQDDADDRRDQP